MYIYINILIHTTYNYRKYTYKRYLYTLYSRIRRHIIRIQRACERLTGGLSRLMCQGLHD